MEISSLKLKTSYKEIFGQDPDLLAKSPGRINIIGEHTDYNEGFVLPTAIDNAVFVAIGVREDDKISVYAEEFKEKFEADLNHIAISEIGWANYVLGVVNQIQERNLTLKGFNLYIVGNVPAGAGLSSSAALECSVAFILNELFQLGLSRQEIAKIGQMTEHTYVGVKCGIMDQFASVLSKEGAVLKLDCRDLSFEYVPLELGDYEVVLFNTNVKHSLASSAYNDRRASCEQAVAWVKEIHPEVNSLRDVTVAQLETIVQPKDQDVFVKSRYVVQENERLNKACDALKSGDIAGLGEQMFLAHAALSKEYEVSCEELDFLAEYVKDKPEVVGARMMGGGFGGCTINIIKKGFGDSIAAEIAPIYKAKFGLDLTVIPVKTSGGSQIIT
ncbi:galactokinase [Sphingobacterium sp. Mn56C]|uniref:galactokinase n=1 Tax=Sphingobacterium sp. Mn56C TaxID=3395261 RepID=UPI003BEC21A5